jgi:hypothetical protein
MNFQSFLNQVSQAGGLETRISFAAQAYPLVAPNLPNGAMNPPVTAEQDIRKLEEEAKYQLKMQEAGYAELVKLLAGKVPSPISEAYVRFARNMQHSLALLEKKREDRKDLKSSELFPFWKNMNQTVHALFNPAFSELPIEHMMLGLEEKDTQLKFSTILKLSSTMNLMQQDILRWLP